MSLTYELKQPDSEVRRFLEALLSADLEAVQETYDGALRGAVTTRPPHRRTRPPWARIGTAFNIRIGYSFDLVPPYASLLGAASLKRVPLVGGTLRAVLDEGCAPFWALRGLPDVVQPGALRALGDGRWLGLDGYATIELEPPPPLPAEGVTGAAVGLCRRLAAFASEHQILGRPLDPGTERVLCRVCYLLALYEEVYRGGLRVDSLLAKVRPSVTADELLGMVGEEQDTIADLTALADRLMREAWPALEALGLSPATVNPMFIPHWADGDLVVGNCLLDVKATVRPEQLDPAMLLQLLGYALLDLSDLYGIRRVGLYLARQARVVVWELATLVPDVVDQDGALRRDVKEKFFWVLDTVQLPDVTGYTLAQPLRPGLSPPAPQEQGPAISGRDGPRIGRSRRWGRRRRAD